MSTTGKFARLAALTMFSAAPLAALSAQQAAPAPQQGAAQTSPAAPNINITPRRVVFDGAKRNEAVYVFNQGTAPVTVNVALVDNVMLESGEILPVEPASAKDEHARAAVARLKSARQLVLATPSRMTIEPGKGKTVRLRAALPDGSGEARTHLTVTTVPPPDTGLTAEAAAAPRPRELAFRIQSVFGVSIPLIVRSGPPQAALAIDGLSLERAPAPAGSGRSGTIPVLSFTLARTGGNSGYGNIEARVQGGRSSEVIGFIRGIGVYPEIDRRLVAMPLSRDPKRGETITVTFTSDDPQLSDVRASGRLAVP